MEILSLLKAEHKEVAAMLEKLAATTTRSQKTRQTVFEKLNTALTIHADFEEQYFYPSVKETAKTKDLVLEAYEEHHIVKILLSELQSLSPEDERWKAKITVLQESVRHHVNEEEKSLFPKVKTILDKTQLLELGQNYIQYKKEALSKEEL